MCGRPYLDTMHMDCANLIMWYLSIWWFDSETRNTVVIDRIPRSFSMICNKWINAYNARTNWCKWWRNKMMHVMQEWFFFFFFVHRWSLQSSSLIKSWVQNRVSTMICESRFFILLAKTFETILYTTLPKLIGLYTEMSCGLFFFGIKAMCV